MPVDPHTPHDSELPTGASDSTSPGVAPDATPARIGRYEIRRLLGRGGMGAVYESFDTELLRTVAVKTVARAGAVEHARAEARTLARLDHPAIARLLDAGTFESDVGPLHAVVMEYIPGAMPVTHFARRRALTPGACVELLLPVCDALHGAHALGVIHRDVKPANVLVDADARARVIDFGIAAGPIADPTGLIRAREQGSPVGTIEWMAPEQCELNPERLDARTDVHALGLILFELLTRAAPRDLSGLDAHGVLERIRTTTPARARTFNKRLAPDLDAIVARALEPDPARRYESCDALARDLRGYLRGRRPDAAPRRPWSPALDLCRSMALRRPRALALTTLLLTAIVSLYVAWPLTTVATPFHARWMALSSAHPPPRTLTRVRSILVGDADDPVALALSLGIEGVDADDATSWRALHATLVERLAGAGPAAVVFDIAFADREAPHDDAFARALASLREAGIDAIAVRPSWAPGASRVDGDLAPHLRLGGATGRFDPRLPWTTIAAVEHNGRVVPSIDLLGAACVRAPGATHLFELDRSRERVEVRSTSENDSSVARAWSVGVRAWEAGTPDPARGIEASSVLAHYPVVMPDERALAEARTSLSKALAMSADELRASVAGRVVVVGNVRAGADRFLHPDGRRLSGCEAHAAAIEAILSRPTLTPESQARAAWTALGASAFGAGVLGAIRSGTRRIGAIVVLGGLAFGASLLVARWVGYLSNPAPPLAAAVLAGEGLAAAARARSRRLAGQEGSGA